MAFLVLTRFLSFESLCSPMKAQLQAELASAADDTAREEITAAFASREKALEHDIDHRPLETHLTLEVSYNVRATHTCATRPHPQRYQLLLTTTLFSSCAVPLEVSVLPSLTGRRGAVS
jgi:hypothetical protein